jgi:deoxyribodipyrimidine photolyase
MGSPRTDALRTRGDQLFGKRGNLLSLWQEIADKVGMTKVTLQRRVKETTGTWDRSVAMELHAAGKWPPKRKMAG